LALDTHRETQEPTPTLAPLRSWASTGPPPRRLVPEPHIKLPSDYPFIDTSSGGRVDGMIGAADRVLAAKPTAEYDEKWGSGFINAERLIGLVYESLP
jgi:hypothetical protein